MMEGERKLNDCCEIDFSTIFSNCRYDNCKETSYYSYLYLSLIIQFSFIITITSISFATGFHEYFIGIKGITFNTMFVCMEVYISLFAKDITEAHFAISFFYTFNMIVYMFLLSYLTDPSNIKVALIIVISNFITVEIVVIIFRKVNYLLLGASPIITTIIEIILFHNLYIQDGSVTWRLSLIMAAVIIYMAIILGCIIDIGQGLYFSFGLLLYDLGLFVPGAIILFIPFVIIVPCIGLCGNAIFEIFE